MDNGTGYSQLFSGVLTREDSRSLRQFRFFVPPGATDVFVRLVYTPRREDERAVLGPQEFRGRWAGEIDRYRGKLRRAGDQELLAYFERFVDGACVHIQPLQNLLNLAVFDSRGSFRGRWDSPQHFGEWVSIGEAHATRGFVAGVVPPGEWTIVLECHAVVTDACSFELGARCAVSEGLWLRGELHAHTNHSDGALPPAGLVEAAREAGLDFIAVTDHNTVSALVELDAPCGEEALGAGSGPRPGSPAPASAPAPGSGAGASPVPGAGTDHRPLVIPGMELTTFYGHAVALGVSEFIPWHDASKGEGLNRQAREVHRLGGLFSVAHPFSIGYPVCAGCEWEYENTDPGLMDLIEVWSGPWTSHIMWNTLAIRWWDELLCRGYRVTGVAARDAHKREELFERETADTYVWARSLSQRDILEALRSGRVYMSSGPRLDFSLAVPGSDRRYLPGDRVRVSRDARLNLGAELARQGSERLRNTHRGRLLARIVKGTREHGASAICTSPVPCDCDGEGRAEFEDTAAGDAWYRCEILADGRSGLPGPRLVALTNPIFVEVISSEAC